MSEFSLSRELRFIVDVCINSNSQQPIPEGIDWKTVMEQLRIHGVKSLFANNLSGASSEIPAQIADDLKVTLRESIIQHLHHSAQFIRLQKSLLDNGIPAFPTKGPLWSYLFYPVPGTRSFSDLDFIIPIDAISKARETVEANGYEIEPYRKYLIEKGNLLETLIAEDTQLMFCGKDPSQKLTPVEIHWRVIYRRFGDFLLWEELTQDAREYSLNGFRVVAPRPEYQFLLLVIHHGLLEQWSKIKFVVDLVFLLRKEGANMDWNFVRAKASEKAILNIVTQALTLAKKFDNESVPKSTATWVPAESNQGSLPEEMWEKGRKEVSTQSFRILMFNIRHRDTLTAKVSVLARHFKFLSRYRLHLYKLLYSKQNPA